MMSLLYQYAPPFECTPHPPTNSLTQAQDDASPRGAAAAAGGTPVGLFFAATFAMNSNFSSADMPAAIDHDANGVSQVTQVASSKR